MGAAAGSIVSGLNPINFNTADPLVLFIIQATIIIVTCYVLNLFLRKLKQPRVISEVIAGILLGPSVMGYVPGWMDKVFNPLSLPYLNLVANLGLVLFLFLVGLELDPKLVVQRARFALGISFAGMALPLGVGAAVSYVLYEELDPDNNVPFGQFLLFTGVAMSITAFPVLARILAEQKLLNTTVGFLTICAGAVGDIVAWVLLALVVSIINSSSKITPLYVILLAIGWCLILVYCFRPLFTYLIRVTKSQDEPSQSMMAFTLVSVLLSAFVTDVIGVHAIFGSFLVGLIIPHESGFADGVTKRLEDLVSVLFLPIYFALSGLKTQVALLDNGRTWGLVILTTFVACFGKIVGCTGAARLQGMEWRESAAIGVLMNCKGLVELIVLNIGYDAGVINARVFVIMVAMCLITTCMTTPVVTYLYPLSYQREVAARNLAKRKLAGGDLEHLQDINADQALNIHSRKGYMICLDKMQNLPAMMTFIQMLNHPAERGPLDQSSDIQSTPRGSSSTHGHGGLDQAPTNSALQISTHIPSPPLFVLRLLHLTERSSSVLMAATQRWEVLRRDTLMTVLDAFAKLNFIKLEPRMRMSTDPDDFAMSIFDEAQQNNAGVIIFPWNSTSLPDPPPVISPDGQGTILSRPLVASNTQVINRLLSTTRQSGVVTGVFVDREFGGSGHFQNIMVFLYQSADDEDALRLASGLSHHRSCRITVVRVQETTIQDDLDDEKRALQRLDDDNSDVENIQPSLPKDPSALVQVFFPHRALPPTLPVNDKKAKQQAVQDHGIGISVETVPTIQDGIGLAKATLGPRDLMVLGRGWTVKGGSNFPSHLRDTSASAATGVASGASPAGLNVHTIPTWLSTASSTPGTPTVQPTENPLDSHNHTDAGPGSSGLRQRQGLRHQASSHNIHHSTLMVSSVLGVMSQTLLASEVSSCFLVVQSGSSHHGSSNTPGEELSSRANTGPGGVTSLQSYPALAHYQAPTPPAAAAFADTPQHHVHIQLPNEKEEL